MNAAPATRGGSSQSPRPVIAIVQARMAASRLPNKVLLDIGGQPMLARVVERARRAASLQGLVVATTTDSSDDPLQAFCRERGYLVTRGSPQDVLDRYYQTARQFGAGVIVRITADCPVIDPGLIDLTVAAFKGLAVEGCQLSPVSGQQSKASNPSPKDFPAALNRPHSTPFDFAANRLPPPWGRTYPIGLDVEVCTFDGLETAWREAVQPHQREHVMPYFYENPQRFNILLVNHTGDYGALRWTVDTPQDLELLRQIYARFDNRDDFSWQDVLARVQSEPELSGINAGVQAKHYQAVDERFGGKPR